MRVGILTSGGDCQALNATMRGLALTLYQQEKDVEIIGFKNGYRGLMNGDYQIMQPDDFIGILDEGGTILGSSRCPFKKMRVIEDGFDKVEAMKKTYKKLKLNCLVVLGGNGSQKSANMLQEEGLNVIGLPKTIDNDIWGTDYTFGYQSATDIATRFLEEITTTMKSHSRVAIVEIMGHKVGHICLSAGIAAGADIILLPEIPYSIDIIAKKIKEREKQGKLYTIIACAEGAISKKQALMSKKQYKEVLKNRGQLTVAHEIAALLAPKIKSEVRVASAGHSQRGGRPCAYDKKMGTLFGVEGANLILEKKFGRLVVLDGDNIRSIKLSESAGKLKYVDIEEDTVVYSKRLGICFGDE